jgi:glycerate kinase
MQQQLTVVVAPSGFKESMSAQEAARSIADGVRAATPHATVIELPLVDGGEGFTETLVEVTGGRLYPLTVTGPVGLPVRSHFGILGGRGPKTAVIEMAAAAGLRLVPRTQRNPLATTTYGVGELIRAALDMGVKRILLGCGDSGTNDGGAGMAQALGVRLLDADDLPIGWGGAELTRLVSIDRSRRDPRLGKVRIDVACNIHNLLCGPRGVARVFGPQKGASPETVETLARALDNYAGVIERDLGVDVRLMAGGGASGGLGAGLHALIGARLHPRYDIVMQYYDIDRYLRQADLVITAEGGIDFQTPYGKIPAEVARRAKEYNVPVIALAGTVGQGARDNYAHGITAFTSVLPRPCTLEEAFTRAAEFTAACAENVMQMVLAGMQLNRRLVAAGD